MTGKAKRKGDKAEREAAELICELTGYEVRRKLGAGRTDDEGDLEGLPNVTIQVCDWADTARAAREKPKGAEDQRENAGTDYAATFVRFRGGTFRVVLTPEQWLAYVKLAVHTFT